MAFKKVNENPECTSLTLELCGEVLRRIEDKQKEHFTATGQKCSKRLAIYKLILGK